MSQFFQMHPDNPQPRLAKQAVEILRGGGLIAYPTDSGYALGCCLGQKREIERMRTIRRVDSKHNFTLLCSDLSAVGEFAKVNNAYYRLLKAATPGAFTFILSATREVPRQMMHPKKRTIGIRVPSNRIAHAILAELGEPLISTTLIAPNETEPFYDPWEIRSVFEHQLDLIIDGGWVAPEPTTVIDLTEDIPQLLRKGGGDWTPFIPDEL